MLGPFESRTLINGSMLKRFIGQNISIMLCVEDEMTNKFIGNTTDELKVSVTLPHSIGVSTGLWVEVIGRPIDGSSIRGQEVILFGDENVDFDKDGYNHMAHYMNNCKDIFRYG